ALIYIYLLWQLLIGRSNAYLPAEEYWRAKLPNTEMPKALQDLLQKDTGSMKNFAEASVDNWQILYNIFNYNYLESASPFEKYLVSRANLTIFFLYSDLHPNTKMNLLFTKSTNKATFLSREKADYIPFSSDKLSDILIHFSITTKSKAADAISKTLKQCEAPTIEGENKYCATSLESLVNFNIATLGENIEIYSTPAQEETKKQEYTISEGAHRVGDNAVICHKQRYAYAVFYCHVIHSTDIYLVSLAGADGTRIEAVAVCHMDTSTWSPNHLAFQVLQVEPGPAICHFPGSDTLVWSLPVELRPPSACGMVERELCASVAHPGHV
ncbi:hypothetical protein Tsubulata_000770, partial [Turnera subulata]